jgi:hypothetical protein
VDEIALAPTLTDAQQLAQIKEAGARKARALALQL